MRILVTGSRHWSHPEAVERCLINVQQNLGSTHVLTLVSGHCPTGADAIAEEIAQRLGWELELHPADWSQGRKAGPERNRKMVESNPDYCLSFPESGSRGTWGCVKMSVNHGIPTFISDENGHTVRA